MKRSKHRSQQHILVAIVMLIVAPVTVWAGRGGILDQTGCSVCCPECKHTCKLDAEEIEVDKTCFEIESKVICIPRVVFPWQTAKKKKCASCTSCDGKGCTNCVHNGAKTRTICVAKPKKYKCPACKYTWSAEKKGCCDTCGPTCAGECGSSAGCDAGCDVGVEMIQSNPMPSIMPVAPHQSTMSTPVENVMPYYGSVRNGATQDGGLVGTNVDVIR